MTNSDSSESCIRLRLTVRNVKVGREIIKRVTAKGNEVVEVNGFTFVRKRKPCPGDGLAAQHGNSTKRQLLAQEHPAHGTSQEEKQQLVSDEDVQGGPAAARNGNVRTSPACQEGSMEADAVHTGEGDSQVQVQLLPSTEAHIHGAETIAPGVTGACAAQGSLEPACPASPRLPLLSPDIPTDLPAEAQAAATTGLFTAEGLGAQLASCLPASCPKLVKLHFVVARALDAAAVQANTPVRRTAHSLSQAFMGLIEQEVAACRQQLVDSAMHAADLQEAPTAVTGVEQAQGEKQQGQEQVEATESQVAATDAAAQMEGQQGSGLAGLPPLLHDAVTEGSTLALSLQQQLAQLEAEEAAWLSLKQAYARPPAAYAPVDGGRRAAQGEVTHQHLPADGGTTLPPADGERATHREVTEQQQPQQQEAGESEQARSTCCNNAQGVPAPAQCRADVEAADCAGAAHAADGNAAAERAGGACAVVLGLHEDLSAEAGRGHEALAQSPLIAVNCAKADAGGSKGAAAAAERETALMQQAATGAGAAAVAAAAAQPLPQGQMQGEQQGQQQQGEQQQGTSTAGGEEGQGAPEEGSSCGADNACVSSDACVRALEEARVQAGARLMTQVELLASRLARVELMVGRAEQVANSMQADYHQDRFRTFPHVNSPAWLIRRITQAKPPAWMGADAAVV